MSVFDIDSKPMQTLNSIGEMMILNVCWLIGSLPIVTIGASCTAMYTVMGRRLRHEGSGTAGPFFRAWLENLRSSTGFWILQALCSVSLVLMFLLSAQSVVRGVLVTLLVLINLVFSLTYPQIARYENRWFSYLRNAVILFLPKLGWIVLNLLVLLAPVLLFLAAPVTFVQYSILWLLFGFSAQFYLSAKLQQRILLPLEQRVSS